MHYDWNPFKIDDAEPILHHQKAWNFDPRNESYYLGRVNESRENDLNMRYFTDGKTGRYYRKGEMQQEENTAVKEVFRNNSHEGKRTRNFNFKQK
ncbi:MAG: hypothetical protein ACTHK0_18990 [Ginsengibacter sp.]